MKDTAGNAIDSTIVAGDLGSVTVDGDAPDFIAVTATDGDYGVGETLSITVIWDEAFECTMFVHAQMVQFRLIPQLSWIFLSSCSRTLGPLLSAGA